ncbi:heterokaryon incompatibility protein-domain-containing protein [Annulohypoxylon maeteangense]|uniref:heterokaryon incompatibility protein-domain-containing protein n=1 Tax=Annulohypoxylon maeteangense TaxID=1927788 RepID=UPI0020081E1B|nr:heterokaryon incompatibility protein-domain-containing protein [Annulohypoxylon maeteangense]KAI0884939.1 heterokaryon incompatibility protein-domain-containing protein [Annulohypoxylon maeteangense]
MEMASSANITNTLKLQSHIISGNVEKEALPPYEYLPLAKNIHTRVLDLQPAINSGAPLHATLRHVDLDSDLFFDAVSYTWGEPIFNEELIIDETSSVKITANLRDALVRFRLPTEVRHLWVDAVCINQSDNREKEKQIPRMAQIYRGASSVLVWLGNSQEGSVHVRNIALSTQRLHSTNSMKEANDREIQDIQRALDGIVRLPWFSRRWIIQEASLNPNVTLFCGKDTVPWLRVLLATAALPWELVTRSKILIQVFKRCWESHVGLASGYRQEIIELLVDFSDAACSDPRDIIYAIAGLAQDVAFGAGGHNGEKIVIDVDYTKSVEEVFDECGFSMASSAVHLRGRGNECLGRFLTEAITRADGSRLGGHCSWAPDWRLPKIRVPIRNLYDDLNITAHKTPKATLVLPDAYYIGSVACIFRCFPKDTDHAIATSWINDLLEWAKEQVMANKSRTYLSDEETEMILVQLLYIMVGGEAGWARPKLPAKIADYIEEVSTMMQGRLVFSILPVTYSGQQETSQIELGIGPSHTYVGDMVCSAGVRPDEIREKWSAARTRYLLFRETRQSAIARAKPLLSCLSGDVGGEKRVTNHPTLLNWSDFEFEMIGDSYASPIRSFLMVEHRRSNEQPAFQVNRINIV